MGFTKIKATVGGPKGKETLNFLVDSGAMYTVLPATVWKKIGLTPKRTLGFILADGTKIKRKISECRFRYGKLDGTTTVVLGEKNDAALLGAYTLEGLNLVLNPFDRTLRPAKAMMA